MIDITKLKKLADVLNSEGCILGLHIDSNNNLFFESYLKDGKGTIFYSVDRIQLMSYLQSKILLSDLYKESQSFLIQHKFRTEVKTYLKDDFWDSLQCGSTLYKDISESMKSTAVEKEFGGRKNIFDYAIENRTTKR